MKIENIIQLPFYSFQCPDNILDGIKEDLNSITWIKNVTNSVSVDRQIENLSLETWFNSCLEEFRSREFSQIDAKITVRRIWANKTEKIQHHHKHLHGNSLISGILYLNTFQGYGNTVFYYPNPWWHLQNYGGWNINDSIDKIEYTYEHTPKEGQLLLFPSHLFHSTKPSLANNIRYSIAFVSHFKGRIGRENFSDLVL
jgi:uncharacterized protein (TIGR02466 family)